MGAEEPRPPIELIDTSGAGAAGSAAGSVGDHLDDLGPSTQRAEARRRGLPLRWLGLVAVAAVAWLVLGGTTATEPTAPLPRPEGAEPADSPTVSIIPVPPVADQSARSPVTPGIDGVARVRAVLTSPTGQGARLVTMTLDGPGTGEVTVDELPALGSFAFDASGQWLAGLGTGSLADRHRTLWVGPVGGPLEPLAVGLRSFAWHDEQPGVIGWSVRDQPEVVVATLDRSAPAQLRSLPIEGRLRGLGEWGMAIETSFRDFATALVDHDGQLLAHLPGRYRGRLADGDLVLGGGEGPPLRYSVDDGRAVDIPWLADDDDLWALQPDPAAGETIALVTRDGNLARPLRAEVIRIDATGATIEGRLDALSPVGVSQDGRILVARQATDDPGDRGALEVVGSHGEEAVALPDVFAGTEWVAALTLV